MKKSFLLGALALLLVFGFIGCDLGDEDSGKSAIAEQTPTGWTGIKNFKVTPATDTITVLFKAASAGTGVILTNKIIYVEEDTNAFETIKSKGTPIVLDASSAVLGAYTFTLTGLRQATTYTVAAVSENTAGEAAYAFITVKTKGTPSVTIERKISIWGFGVADTNRTIDIGLLDAKEGASIETANIKGTGLISGGSASSIALINKDNTPFTAGGQQYYVYFKLSLGGVTSAEFISKEKISFALATTTLSLSSFDLIPSEE